ncbi:MAG: DUF1127 domain-containing protein [Pseudomonadota bacterium]
MAHAAVRSGARASAFDDVIAALTSFAGRWRRARAYERTLRELEALDAKMLDDIGLMPGDLPSAARRAVRGIR